MYNNVFIRLYCVYCRQIYKYIVSFVKCNCCCCCCGCFTLPAMSLHIYANCDWYWAICSVYVYDRIMCTQRWFDVVNQKQQKTSNKFCSINLEISVSFSCIFWNTFEIFTSDTLSRGWSELMYLLLSPAQMLLIHEK